MFSVSVAQVKWGYMSADRMSFMLMNIFAMNSLVLTWSHLGPDRGREGGREGRRREGAGGRERKEERGKEGEREGKREGEREGKREGEREGGREGRERGKERGWWKHRKREGSDIMNVNH